MKPDPERIRALLADVFPAPNEDSGPSSADVLSMLRHEQHRRSRWRTGSALVMLSLLVATSLFLHQREPAKETPTAQAPAKPQPIVIHTVNDDELLALLHDTPAALVKMPDGSSTLFLIAP